MLVLAVCVLLVALGWWTYHAVENSLREIRAASLMSLLDSEANSLRVWITEEIGDAERIARDPRVRDEVADLVRLSEQPGVRRAEICAGPVRAALEATLRPLLRDAGDATFNLTARSGRLIATRYPEYCGLEVDAARFRPLLEPVFDGRPRFLRPFKDAERIASPPQLRAGPPFAWVAVPVRDAAGQVIAALGVAEPADAVFASILQASRPGKNGEAYAFDERGAILSGEWLGEIAPLRAQTGGIAGEGVVLDPYRNHRGAEVIGAWRWLPDYGLGVAIEIEAAEAYAPLQFLQIAFGGVFGALVIAVIIALASGLSVLRLRRQVGEARRLGAYRLERLIGEGGMANVYLAKHAMLKRPTAVKILKPHRASDEFVARFEREVRLASQLRHPNTVEIYDFGRTPDGLSYYAMEYLDGITLGELVKTSGAVPVARVVHLLRQVCAGLAEAHAKGLVHRDVKPENIMVCARGGECDVVKILDFGLVKNVADPHSRDLTRSLRILGTPLYMSPERIRNPTDADARADIYALGAVAFYLLTGTKLFEAADDLAIASGVLNDEAPRPSTRAKQEIPFELDLLVLACLQKKREDRPQRVTDLIETFDALATGHRWTQKEAAAWWEEFRPAR